jgi:hypothetical protein
VVQSDVYDKQICDLETSISHSLRMVSQPLYLRKKRNNYALCIIKPQQEIVILVHFLFYA